MITKEDMTHEDALDHFYYNVSGAYVGEYTPIFVHDLEWGVMPNKKLKKKKKKKIKNIHLNKDGRTANQVKRKRKKLNDKKMQ